MRRPDSGATAISSGGVGSATGSGGLTETLAVASAAAALRRAATSTGPDEEVRARCGSRSIVRARWLTSTRSASESCPFDGVRARTISFGLAARIGPVGVFVRTFSWPSGGSDGRLARIEISSGWPVGVFERGAAPGSSRSRSGGAVNELSNGIESGRAARPGGDVAELLRGIDGDEDLVFARASDGASVGGFTVLTPVRGVTGRRAFWRSFQMTSVCTRRRRRSLPPRPPGGARSSRAARRSRTAPARSCARR